MGGEGKATHQAKGPSIIVSEFIEEKDGYLALSDEQYELEVANSGGGIEKSALALLEIGENREGQTSKPKRSHMCVYPQVSL